MTVTDRAAGMLAGVAYGDALGARYEGLHLRLPPQWIRFGRSALVWRTPGWWTDDTDMSLGILLAVADLAGVDYPGKDPSRSPQPRLELTSDVGLRLILANWLAWRRRGSLMDAGVNTVRVLHQARKLADPSPTAVLELSRRQLEHSRRGGGNGAVMRTAPVALAYLGDPDGAAAAASRISELTHPDPRAREAAAVWTVLCERAVSAGHLDLEAALAVVDHDPFWVALFESARQPGRNGIRGWAPTTVADAWWCVRRALEDSGEQGNALDRGVRLGVAIGGDPDTTASVAGGLLGALTGVRDLPPAARRRVHGGGWTGRRWTIDEVAALAAACAAAAE